MSDFVDIHRSTEEEELKGQLRAYKVRVDYLQKQLENAGKTIQQLEKEKTELYDMIQHDQGIIAEYEAMVAKMLESDPSPSKDPFQEAYDEYMQRTPSQDPIPSGYQPLSGIGPTGTHLTHGFGMSLDRDSGAKLYRVSDPDGPLIPQYKFKRAEFEIGRGQGIHFGLSFDKK